MTVTPACLLTSTRGSFVDSWFDMVSSASDGYLPHVDEIVPVVRGAGRAADGPGQGHVVNAEERRAPRPARDEAHTPLDRGLEVERHAPFLLVVSGLGN